MKCQGQVVFHQPGQILHTLSSTLLILPGREGARPKPLRWDREKGGPLGVLPLPTYLTTNDIYSSTRKESWILARYTRKCVAVCLGSL